MLEAACDALVHTVACTGKVASARIAQSAYQFAWLPVAVPIRAKAPEVSNTPSNPTVRGPTRSTSAPIGTQKMALVNVAMVRPTVACERDEPNSDCSAKLAERDAKLP